NHPALAVWHVSNEYGGECHCPLCQERFRAYLKKRFGSLDALNEAWWTSFWSHTYTDWSHIESPSPLGDAHTHGLNLEWKRFTTEQVVDFYLHETAPLKKITPDVPCTTNLMCDKDGTDYFRLAEVMDVAGWDNYPEWTATEKDIDIASYRSFAHDLARSLKDKPFMLIESSPSATNWRSVAKLHRPGVHTLQSMQAVAHGSDTVQYFQFRKSRGSSEKFHGAVVDHEGTENTRVFREVADVGRRLAAMKGVAGAATPSSAAIIYDWNVLWALADAKGFLQEKTGYKETVVSHYRALWGLGISTDVIDQTRSLEGYDLIVAPMLYMLRPGFAEKIASFVQSGGVFAATYGTGYVDENDLCYLGGFPGPLKDVLGIWSEEIDALYPDDRNHVFWDSRMRTYRIFDFCERIHPLTATAQTFLTYGSDFYQGEPVVTVNKYGSGAAWYIAARTEQAFLNDFYAYIVREYHIPRIIDAELPEGVTAQVRSDGKTRYIFLLNFTPDIKFVETKDGVKKLKPWEAVEIATEQGDRL
ncbi:MAG: beta-galactosidase, partial [Spirochaetaceae bacterium]|nr:beta-galactosidase [Spirochaetaceae bacterium]